MSAQVVPSLTRNLPPLRLQMGPLRNVRACAPASAVRVIFEARGHGAQLQSPIPSEDSKPFRRKGKRVIAALSRRFDEAPSFTERNRKDDARAAPISQRNRTGSIGARERRTFVPLFGSPRCPPSLLSGGARIGQAKKRGRTQRRRFTTVAAHAAN